jgi:hypothetical protein
MAMFIRCSRIARIVGKPQVFNMDRNHPAGYCNPLREKNHETS